MKHTVTAKIPKKRQPKKVQKNVVNMYCYDRFVPAPCGIRYLACDSCYSSGWDIKVVGKKLAGKATFVTITSATFYNFTQKGLERQEENNLLLKIMCRDTTLWPKGPSEFSSDGTNDPTIPRCGGHDALSSDLHRPPAHVDIRHTWPNKMTL